jgi:thiosulfate dehydrogenase [quinone] large subunit
MNAVPTLIRPEGYSSAPRNQKIAYLLLRLLTGLDFFGHGYARTFTGTYLPGFAQGIVKSMATAPLSPQLVLITGYMIPIIELLVGTLLLLGLLTRTALTTAFLLMFVLMFGVTMKQDWTAAGTQLQYGLVLAILLFGADRYDLSWPSVFGLKRPTV